MHRTARALPPLRTAASARVLAVVLALLATSWLVVERSQSAFTGTTGNAGSSLTAGSVSLSDDDGGTALFDVSSMVPGQVESRCIEVTYTGSIAPAAPVRLHGGYVDGPDAGTTADSTLAPFLATVVEIGAPSATCAAFGTPTTLYSATAPAVSAGTLERFTTAYTGYAGGLSTGWTPAAGGDAMRPFRITFTLADDNAAQGRTAEPAFTWEARSA